MNADDPKRAELVDKLRQEMKEGHTIRVDPGYLRLWNERFILNYIRKAGSTSRADIVQETGLTRSSVGNIVSDLVEQGFVDEKQSESSTGGRPGSKITLKGEVGYIIGVDIGRSHLTIVITDLEAKSRQKESRLSPIELVSKEDPASLWIYTEKKFNAKLGAEECLPQIAAELDRLVKENSIEWKHVVGIGLGLPGTLDRHRTRLTKAKMMVGWSDVDIPEELRKLLRSQNPSMKDQADIPIYLDNDCNLGALGESQYGIGRKKMDIVFVKWGTGIGAGLIIDGKLYHGSRNIAGELGHQIIDPNPNDQTQCEGCGNKGCLEILAAEPAINRRYEEKSRVKIDSESIVQKAKNKDTHAQEVLIEAARLVGIGIANSISLLDPELIVLGGQVPEDAETLAGFMTALKKHANVCVMAARGTQIEVGTLRHLSVAYGAVAQVLEEAFRAPILTDMH